MENLVKNCNFISSKDADEEYVMHSKSGNIRKRKKAAINPKNEDDKCFQDAATVALNHEEIKREPQRISQIKPFINKDNCNGIKYP